MGYYSAVDNWDFNADFSNSRIDKEIWGIFVESMEESFLFNTMEWDPVFSREYLTGFEIDVMDSGKAYFVEDEIKNFVNFLVKNGVSNIEFDLEISGEDQGDIRRFKVRNSTILVSKAKIVFEDWKEV